MGVSPDMKTGGKAVVWVSYSMLSDILACCLYYTQLF